MTDSFWYQPIRARPSYADRSEIMWRPMLPVRIFGLKGSFDTVALVDTGASETLIPLDFWDEIDPPHREGEVDQLRAANDTEIPVRYATVDLAIRLGRDKARWRATVGFAEARKEMVLGDAGFLRYFAVAFDRHRRKFQVRRAGDLPDFFLGQFETGPMPRPFHEDTAYIIRPPKRR